ncbi:hypothetical protein B6S12_03570, partial [Helicobacter valdiviensis]
MNSIKIKVSLIANFIAIVCLLILGIVTFIYVKQVVLDEAIEEETNYIRTANALVVNFDKGNQGIIVRIKDSILTQKDIGVFNSIESIQAEFDNALYEVRNSLGLLGVYIAHPSGEIVVSNDSSDAINAHSMVFGKKQNYDARTRSWYQEASKLEDGKIYTSDSYIDAASGEHVFTYAMPIYKENKLVGILGIDVLSSTLQEQIKTTPGRVFAFDANTQVFASNDPTLIGGKEGEINPAIKTVSELFKSHKDYEPFYYTRDDGEERFVICSKASAYSVCIAESIDDIEAPIVKIAWIQATIVIFTSIASIILLYFVISHLLKPLSSIQNGLSGFFSYLNHESKNAPKPI